MTTEYTSAKARDPAPKTPSTEKPVDKVQSHPYTTENTVVTLRYHPMYFPPRELEVMSVLWRLGSASVAEVRAELTDKLAYTSVLSALQTLEEKECVRHEPEGRAYRYYPTVDAKHAGKSAVARIKDAIFEGSAERMFAQLVSDRHITQAELQRMQQLITERLERDS